MLDGVAAERDKINTWYYPSKDLILC